MFGTDSLPKYVGFIKIIEDSASHSPSIAFIRPTFFCRQSVPNLVVRNNIDLSIYDNYDLEQITLTGQPILYRRKLKYMCLIMWRWLTFSASASLRLISSNFDINGMKQNTSDNLTEKIIETRNSQDQIIWNINRNFECQTLLNGINKLIENDRLKSK